MSAGGIGPVKRTVKLSDKISLQAREVLRAKSGAWKLLDDGSILIEAPEHAWGEHFDDKGNLRVRIGAIESLSFADDVVPGSLRINDYELAEFAVAGCVSKEQAMRRALKDCIPEGVYINRGIIAAGRVAPSSVEDPSLEWNSASTLPPVACELLLDIDGKPTIGFRTSYVTNKDSSMSYRLADNSEVEGRFRWTYP